MSNEESNFLGGEGFYGFAPPKPFPRAVNVFENP